jgi:hypothetical protein
MAAAWRCCRSPRTEVDLKAMVSCFQAAEAREVAGAQAGAGAAVSTNQTNSPGKQ